MTTLSVLLVLVLACGWALQAQCSFKSALQEYCHLQLTCVAVNEQTRADMAREIEHYTSTKKFRRKIYEANRIEHPKQAKSMRRYDSMLKFLEKHVLEGQRRLLDLGCAAGAMIKWMGNIHRQMGGPPLEAVGIELVPGWVENANKHFPQYRFFQGDITEEIPGVSETFDVITLNDVMEHIIVERYGCLFQNLKRYSHAGTLVYMHVPCMETQIQEGRNKRGQYFENIVSQNQLIAGMRCAGFELVRFEFDETILGHQFTHDTCLSPSPDGSASRECLREKKGYPKYYHILFRQSYDSTVSNVL